MVRPRLFVLWNSHTLFGTWVYIYDLDLWPQHQHYIFTMNLSLAKCLCSWHRHTKFWHMGVSPWDNMLCTFLTLVWPWPLTYMWVTGVSLVSFTHSFYLVSSPELFWSPVVHPFVHLSVHILIFSRTNGPILSKLGTKHPWVTEIQVCLNEGICPYPSRDN